MRGYFLADKEDHLIVSADWSAVELVCWGEFSGDPVFKKAYGQRPHADLHSESAAGVMGITVEELKAMENYKELRTTRGKAASFEFPYSGWLANTGRRLGWTFEETKAAVEGFIEKFSVGVQWRNDTIALCQQQGYVQLPDSHTRIRYEATEQWAMDMLEVFRSYGSEAIEAFGKAAIRKIQKRAFNQAVNAMIQGTCGTLAKRTILDIEKDKPEALDARFMLLIHDELLYSVQKDSVLDFAEFLYFKMIDGQGLFKDLQLDSSLAIGYTFQPFNPDTAPYGQVELSEMPKGLPCIAEDRWGKKATRDEIQIIINYLTNRV